MTDKNQVWQSVFNAFDCSGEVTSVEQFGSGHINDTFLVKTADVTTPDYTFRCINTHVFQNIDGLMDNIAAVTKHVQKKLMQSTEHMTSMHLVHTKTGGNYYRDDLGHVWTCYVFVPGATHEHYHNLKLPAQAGKAFGKFVALLQDLDPKKLCDTIPRFHDLSLRLEQWDYARAMADDVTLNECADWIAFVENKKESMMQLLKLKNAGQLPLRITHNDTKCNNILFDEQHNAVCVIDLDTVMPGLLAYDFGDAIRTATTSHEEDEQDVQKIIFNKEAFAAFTENYMQSVAEFITPAELDSLSLSVTYISFMLGLRFFTDHLSGDVYFKTDYRGHNLIRARNQFRFVEILENEMPWIKSVISRSTQAVDC